MSYTPAPGTTWGTRLWLFVVCLCSAVSILIYREVELPWYFKLPLGVVLVHGFYSAGAAFRASYVRRAGADGHRGT